MLEILNAVLEIVVVEVVLHDGVNQQESAMKDDLKNCITDLGYAKIRHCQSLKGLSPTRPPGCKIHDAIHMVFYRGVILKGILKGVSDYGARWVEDSFVYDCSAAMFRLARCWLHRVVMPSFLCY
jgi:hypothetical protein